MASSCKSTNNNKLCTIGFSKGLITGKLKGEGQEGEGRSEGGRRALIQIEG